MRHLSPAVDVNETLKFAKVCSILTAPYALVLLFLEFNLLILIIFLLVYVAEVRVVLESAEEGKTATIESN